MDLKQLLYFVTIADEGTISDAAKKLYLTQPPLSYQLKQLEKELGATLFERGSRTMTLTDEGQLLYKRAAALLEMARVTQEEVTAYAHSEQGTIRIGMVSSVVSSYAADWISGFARLYPAIQFELHEANTYELLAMLKENTIHLAILRTPYTDAGYNKLTLARESLIALGRSEQGEEKQETCLKELSCRKLIIYRRWKKLLDEAFFAQNLTPQYVCICDDARTAAALVEKQVGIGIMPRSAQRFVRDETIKAMPIRDLDIFSNIELIYDPGSYLPQCSKLFMEYMRNALSDNKECERETNGA